LGQLLLKDGKKETRVIKFGDVVLIGEDTRKHIDWPLVRVVEIIPGRNGQGRVLVLKTKNGMLKRSIQRIYLVISQDEADFAKDLGKRAKLGQLSDKTNQKAKNKNAPSGYKPENCETKITTKRIIKRVIKRPERFKY